MLNKNIYKIFNSYDLSLLNYKYINAGNNLLIRKKCVECSEFANYDAIQKNR